MLGQAGLSPEYFDRITSIQSWTRRRFKLDEGAAVLVSEVKCTVPGCPPLETVVAFWAGDDARHQFRLYKALGDVSYDDIGWLVASASVHEGVGWDCC